MRYALLIALFSVVTWAEPPHVVFVAGDHEYRSEVTMPMIAKILEDRHDLRTSIAQSPSPTADTTVEGLEALETADLAVFFLRWRTLPDEQMERILAYLESGKPLVGLRTTTHSFRFPEGHKYERWNDGFGVEVFGQKWIRHHGHQSTTRTAAAEGAAGHPILRGVDPEMELRSWLYVVEPLHGDSKPLLMGRAVNPQNGVDYGPQPVAWVKTYNGARVFFTTLGHPDDFRNENVRRLVVNGILWALGMDVPPEGADIRTVGEYDPPRAGVPGRDF